MSIQAAPAPADPEPNQPGTGKPTQEDFEIEALRKELQEIKRQLAEQGAERVRSQPGNPGTAK